MHTLIDYIFGGISLFVWKQKEGLEAVTYYTKNDSFLTNIGTEISYALGYLHGIFEMKYELFYKS